MTNFYEVQIKETKSIIYQYSMEVDLPSDSSELLHRVVKSLRKELEEKIGLVTFKGNMLWGLKKNNLPLVLNSCF